MVEYNPTPYSLTRKGIESIVSILKEESITSILEFGSGKSTDYLAQLGYNIVSLDDDTTYASSHKQVYTYDLISLSDEDFEKVINGEVNYFTLSKNYNPVISRSSKQINCFYKLDTLPLHYKLPFIIVDGPNGNGRSLAFRVIEKFIASPCYVFIDDYFHYPFVENFIKVFPNSQKIVEVKESDIKGFVIFKVI
jgi:hypothetical protein